MAIESVGYDGPVDEVGFSTMIPSVGASEYGVAGPSDWAATAHPSTAQAVNIAIGAGWGHGVYDTSDSVVTVQCSPITSGTRWDLIVMDRDWQSAGGLSQFVSITGGLTKALPERLKGRGVHDQQPLWLVQWEAGHTQPRAYVDLRLWAGNGGMYAVDDLVRTYVEKVGSLVNINGSLWARQISNGSGAWVKLSDLGRIPLFGAGNPLLAGPATNAGQFLIQGGSEVATTNGDGFGRIYWSKPFPTGLLTVLLWNGDGHASGVGVTISAAGSFANSFWGAAGFGNKTEIVFEARNADGSMAGNRTCRVNYIVLGW